MDSLLHAILGPSSTIASPRPGGSDRQALEERRKCSQEGSPGVEASARQSLLQAARNSPEHMPDFTPKCMPKDMPRQLRCARFFIALGSSLCWGQRLIHCQHCEGKRKDTDWDGECKIDGTLVVAVTCVHQLTQKAGG